MISRTLSKIPKSKKCSSWFRGNELALYRQLSTKNEETTKARQPEYSIAFWSNKSTWKRAAKNTTNCLVGCNIGDYGMIIALNYYDPSLPFSIVMPAAMASGLVTSVMFETSLLKYKEGLNWRSSFRVATSMSFISMVAMELAENATDFLLTAGQATINEPWFWAPLGISTISGFLAPLPYNYHQIAKHGKSCHGPVINQQQNENDERTTCGM